MKIRYSTVKSYRNRMHHVKVVKIATRTPYTTDKRPTHLKRPFVPVALLALFLSIYISFFKIKLKMKIKNPQINWSIFFALCLFPSTFVRIYFATISLGRISFASSLVVYPLEFRPNISQPFLEVTSISPVAYL